MSGFTNSDHLRPGAASSSGAYPTTAHAPQGDATGEGFRYPRGESEHMSYEYQEMVRKGGGKTGKEEKGEGKEGLGEGGGKEKGKDNGEGGAEQRQSWWGVFCTCRDVR
jgi:hypothetical protein